MVPALEIDWPTAPFGPLSGASSATRCRAESVGSVEVGRSAGGGGGGGGPLGMGLEAGRREWGGSVGVGRSGGGGGGVGGPLGMPLQPARRVSAARVTNLRRLLGLTLLA